MSKLFSTATEWLDYAKQQEDVDNTEEALDAVEKALAKDPIMGEALCLKASLLLDLDKPQEAFKTLSEAVQKVPSDYHCWFDMGAFLAAHRNPFQAVSCFAKVNEMCPEHPKIKYALGNAFFNAGAFPQAAEVLTEALDRAETKIEKAHIYDRLGEAYLQAGEFDKAIAAFDASLLIEDHNCATMGFMALAHISKKEPDAALKCLESAFAISEKFAKLYSIQGLAFELKNDQDAAYKSLTKATEMDPHNPELWYFKARYLANHGKNEEALNVFDQGMEANPDEAELRLHKARLLHSLGRVQDAALLHREGLLMAGRLVAYGLFLIDEEQKCVEESKIAIETDVSTPPDQIVHEYAQNLAKAGHKVDDKGIVDGKFRIAITQIPLNPNPPDLSKALQNPLEKEKE